LVEGKVKALPEFLPSGAAHNLLPWACPMAVTEHLQVSLDLL
jgi:hypothetical protein